MVGHDENTTEKPCQRQASVVAAADRLSGRPKTAGCAHTHRKSTIFRELAHLVDGSRQLQKSWRIRERRTKRGAIPNGRDIFLDRRTGTAKISSEGGEEEACSSHNNNNYNHSQNRTHNFNIINDNTKLQSASLLIRQNMPLKISKLNAASVSTGRFGATSWTSGEESSSKFKQRRERAFKSSRTGTSWCAFLYLACVVALLPLLLEPAFVRFGSALADPLEAHDPVDDAYLIQRRNPQPWAPSRATTSATEEKLVLDISRLWDSQEASANSEQLQQQGQDQARDLTRRHRRSSDGDGDEQRAQCRTLVNLWKHLERSYPTLASHLLHWASRQLAEPRDRAAPEGPLVIGQQFQLGRLLEEANKQLQLNDTHTPRPQQQQPGGRSNANAWLARVTAKNPSYANLISHLRSRLQQHGQPGTSALPAGGQPDQQQQLSAQDGEPPVSGRVSYGRVAYYPRELAGSGSRRRLDSFEDGGSDRKAALQQQGGESEIETEIERLGSVQTIDKLHLLNQYTRLRQQQQQQQQLDTELQSNQIGRAPVASVASPAETDRFEQMNSKDWRKSSEAATDAARKNVFYGQIMLGPNQARGSNLRPELEQHNRVALGERRQPQSSRLATLIALRELANQQGFSEGQRARHFPPTHSDPTQDRLVEGPAMSSVGGAQPRANSKGGGGGGDAPDGDEGSNELLGQQRPHQYSVDAGSSDQTNAVGAPGGGESEFEGHFHAGPLKQIEVRQLRSSESEENSDRNGDSEPGGKQRRANADEPASSAGRAPLSGATTRDVFIVD